MPLKRHLLVLSCLSLLPCARAQFADSFDHERIEGWFTMTGDGTPTLNFVPKGGFARMEIDATQDRFNVWWTLIKRDIAGSVDLKLLADPAYELRVEARVRASHAPRRVNFMINTQRTTDFHQHLREYDLPDTTGWHTISFTTRDLDAKPGDSLFVQLAATDWGDGKYHLDVDHYRADVVRRDSAAPDVGEPLVYHPVPADPATFAHHVEVTHDSVIHPDFPEVNFNDWKGSGTQGTARILTVDARQVVVMRWDLKAFRGARTSTAGLLELTTWSVMKGGDYVSPLGEDLGVEFGKVRVVEILGGDPQWDQKDVTYQSLLAGSAEEDVFNTQMVIDLEVTEGGDGKTYATLPRPVVQRLLDGRTKGLVVRPLGAIVANFHASEDDQGRGPKLHLNAK